MSITAVCHKCGNFVTAPDSAAGTLCQCPHCEADVQIPGGVAKHCCVCQADVANAPRTKDAAGNYYCAACGAKAVAAKANTPQPADPSSAPALADAEEAAACVICKAQTLKAKLANFDGQLVCHRCAAAEGLGTMPYRLRKPRLGSARVIYHCPRCRGELESALAEAGKPDACPQCGCDLEVPGRYEKFKTQRAAPTARPDDTVAAAAPAPAAGQPAAPSAVRAGRLPQAATGNGKWLVVSASVAAIVLVLAVAVTYVMTRPKAAPPPAKPPTTQANVAKTTAAAAKLAAAKAAQAARLAAANLARPEAVAARLAAAAARLAAARVARATAAETAAAHAAKAAAKAAAAMAEAAKLAAAKAAKAKAVAAKLAAAKTTRAKDAATARATAGRWHKIGMPVRAGDAVVTVAAVKIRDVPLIDLDGSADQSAHRLLEVFISIRDRSAARILHYGTWRGNVLGNHQGSLGDDAGNYYRQCTFGVGVKLKGQSRAISDVYPGKEVRDVLVFERPVAAAKVLRLKLPGGNIGWSHTLRFAFPVPSGGGK